jgi:hypothetical protein
MNSSREGEIGEGMSIESSAGEAPATTQTYLTRPILSIGQYPNTALP